MERWRGRGPGANSRGLSFTTRRKIFLFLLGAPAVAYVLAVTVWPLTQGIFFSFFKYSLLNPAGWKFVGLGNYRELWTDAAARGSLITTALFTISAVAIEFLLGLGLALLLWRDTAFHRVCLALLLIPVTMTPLVVGLTFRALLAPDFGMIGYFASEWGLSSPRGFLGDPNTALGTLVAIDAWQWTPFMALILLAGLKSLPTDILEAAEADGATAAQRLRIIIMPMLLPAIFLALVLRTMDAFRVFDIVFSTTNGGPADATNVLMVFAVKQGLEFFNVGFASAIANTSILCIAVFSIAFVALVRRADRRASGR
ncbi:MAG: carbohydrate ABC transporter permease [Hyphomicrobiales bacterium]